MKRICKICGGELIRKKYRRDNRSRGWQLESIQHFINRRYCSQKCYWESLKELTGKLHNSYKPRIKKICPICKKEFSVLPSRNQRIYCSRSCAIKENHLRGNHNVPCGWNKGKRTPLKIRLKMREAKLKNPTRYWLNKKRPEMRKIIKSGWGEFRKQMRERTEYKQWLRFIFERDDFTCQICGARSGNGKAVYLEGHHLLSAREYPEFMLEKDNGITLCQKCHRELNGREKQILEVKKVIIY